MAAINHANSEVVVKVVYYGPALCGKTTNLQCIHENLPGTARGKMLSLATETDRTIFFDFLPVGLGRVRNMNVRMQLYTVPGQVYYNATRQLVLKGVDGVVFVADSQTEMLDANIESFRNLEENLRGDGRELVELPHVLQFNKRDLQRLSSEEELKDRLNKYEVPTCSSVAIAGSGVHETLKQMVRLVLDDLARRYHLDVRAVV
jgi:signal recognition particle receptor subunit beta